MPDCGYCGKRFHACGSCGLDWDWEYRYCSAECFTHSEEFGNCLHVWLDILGSVPNRAKIMSGRDFRDFLTYVKYNDIDYDYLSIDSMLAFKRTLDMDRYDRGKMVDSEQMETAFRDTEGDEDNEV